MDFKGTVVNRTLPPLHRGSIEITEVMISNNTIKAKKEQSSPAVVEQTHFTQKVV